jgi:cytochrome P450
VRALEAEVSEIAGHVLQEIKRTNSFTDSELQCDFVTDVSARIPIDVIAALLGVPKPDRPQLFRWTNQTIGLADSRVPAGCHRAGNDSPVPQSSLCLLR